LEFSTGRLRATLRGHRGRVQAIAFAPDGHDLLSAGFDRMVRQWDLSTSGVRRTLLGHRRAVTGVSVSGDGRWAASSSQDGTIRVWTLTR
jgi:WD40 repeat protein